MRRRTNLKVGKPTDEVIFLTCLFLPSVNVILIHEVGIDFLNLTGGSLKGNNGSSSMMLTLDGFVLYILPFTFISTPLLNISTASLLNIPSTCTQYSLSCREEG